MNYQKHSQITQNSANPPARQRTSIFWILGAALILALLLAVSSSAVQTASAESQAGSLEIDSVNLAGGAPWVPHVPDNGLSNGAGVAQAAPQCFGLADIVLVLDQSGSIDENQSDLQEAAKALIDELLPDGVTGVRIGITRFSTDSTPVHVMSIDPISLNAAIDNLDDPDGGTNIVGGLQGGALQFITGLGDRSEVPNKIIFITDGNDSDDGEDKRIEIAAASQLTGAEVFAVGVGSGVQQLTLDAIATDPDSEHSFLVTEFAVLILRVKEIAAAAAPVSTQTNQDGDLIIPVDASIGDISGCTVTFSVAGLPAGLSIDANTGFITGTVDGNASQGGLASDGVYTVVVEANDGNGGVTTYQFS